MASAKSRRLEQVRAKRSPQISPAFTIRSLNFPQLDPSPASDRPIAHRMNSQAQIRFAFSVQSENEGPAKRKRNPLFKILYWYQPGFVTRDRPPIGKDPYEAARIAPRASGEVARGPHGSALRRVLYLSGKWLCRATL